ncbi:hypothetical protein MM300_08620 [Evansella sp. LMS18]|uniref:hypothetical protein n=1 Tax=Evansella sp. LMS18 TaxID=2924033 RepID=UPI0020CFF9E3|nr:hypothetical protein [Evansella sp. LMS18]UTR12337.1 hypothetical protein MM300_08620 [Evansella sp. LMS18]
MALIRNPVKIAAVCLTSILMLSACANGNNQADEDENNNSNTTDQEINQTDENLNTAEEELEEVSEELEEKREELRAKEEELQELEQRISEKEEELNTVKEDIETTEEELQAVQNELNELEEELSQKRNELASVEEELEEAQGRQEDSESGDNNDEDPADNGDGENAANGNGDTEHEQIQEKADSVVIGLENEDFGTVATHVHPEKGVRFSPYGHVDTEEHLVFSREEVRNFMEDEEEYMWGTQDGSGHPIELTPAEYYEEYIYIRDFSRSAEEINYNEVESRGNTIVNVEEVYPDANFMEYYVSEEEEDLNWAALILAFEKLDGEWYLTGIAVDRWTI